MCPLSLLTTPSLLSLFSLLSILFFSLSLAPLGGLLIRGVIVREAHVNAENKPLIIIIFRTLLSRSLGSRPGLVAGYVPLADTTVGLT